MKSVPFAAETRTKTKRPGSKELRADGRVPAVVYGSKSEPRNLQIEAKAFHNLVKHSVSEAILVDLSVDGGDADLALVQEVQHHPLSGEVLHVDFQRVTNERKVVVTVPIETKGEAKGVKLGGGVLERVLHKVKIRALPKDLPEFLEIDVSDLDVGQTIHVGEITAVEGVEVLGSKSIPVLSIAKSRAARAAQNQAAAAAKAEAAEDEKK